MNPEEILEALRKGWIKEEDLNDDAKAALAAYRSGADVEDRARENRRGGGILSRTADMAMDFVRGQAIGAGRALPTVAVGAADLFEDVGLGALAPNPEPTRALLEQRRQETAPRSKADELGQLMGRMGAEALLAVGTPGGTIPRLVGEAATFGSMAAYGPEESALGGIGALVGSETLMRAAENKPLRVAAEVALSPIAELIGVAAHGARGVRRGARAAGEVPPVVGGAEEVVESAAAKARRERAVAIEQELSALARQDLSIEHVGPDNIMRTRPMGPEQRAQWKALWTEKEQLAHQARLDLAKTAGGPAVDSADIPTRIAEIDADLEHIRKAIPEWRETPEVTQELRETRKLLASERKVLEARKMTVEESDELWKTAIDDEVVERLPFREQARRYFHKFVQTKFDANHGINQLSIPGMLPTQDPRILASNLTGFTNEAADAVSHGLIDPGVIDPVTRAHVRYSDGLMDIVEESTDAKGLAYYLAAMREVNDLRPRGKGGWLDDRQVRAAMARAEKTPAIKTAAKKYWKMQDEFLNLLERHGVVTEGAAKRIREQGNHYYAPFETQDLSGIMESGMASGISDPVHRIGKGRGIKIKDPLKSTLSQVYWGYHIIRKKMLHTAIADMALLPDSGVKKLAGKPKGLKEIQNEGLAPEYLRDHVDPALIGDKDGLHAFIDDPDRAAMSYLERDGTTSWFEVPRDVVEGLQPLAPSEHKVAQRVMSYAGKGLRFGTVKTAAFQAFNTFKDTISRAIASNQVSSIPLVNVEQAVTQAYSSAIGMTREALRRIGIDVEGDALSSLYLHSPGGFSNISGTMRNEYLQQLNSLEAGQASALRAASNGGRKVARAIEEVFEVSEQINRNAEFKAVFEDALDGGMPMRDAYELAAYESGRITTNYRKRGTTFAEGFWKGMANATAFFNPKLQGFARTVEIFSERPSRMLTALGTLATPAITMYMINAENDDYWALSEKERQLMMHIPIDRLISKFIDVPEGGNRAFSKVGETVWLRIPYPHDMGLVFGSLPVSILQSFDPRNPNRDSSTAQLMDRVTPDGWNSVLHSVLGLVPATTIGSFAIDIATNRGWTGRDIESGYDRAGDAHPTTRGRERASGFAKLASDILNAVPGGGIPASPAQVDYGVRGLTGRLGTELSQVGGDENEDITHRPMVGSFFKVGGGEYVAKVYDELEDLEKRAKYYDTPEGERPRFRRVKPLSSAEESRLEMLQWVTEFARDSKEEIEFLESKDRMEEAEQVRKTTEIYFRLHAMDTRNRNRLANQLNDSSLTWTVNVLNDIDKQLGVD